MTDWTLEQVAEQEHAHSQLLERLDALAAGDEELSAEIADAQAGGEDAGALREERREKRQERENLDASARVLAERIVERRELAYRALARDRIEAIAGDLGGHVEERAASLERLEGAIDAYEAEAEKLNEAYLTQQALLAEANALSRRFGLSTGEPRTVQAPSRDPDVTAAVRRLADVDLVTAHRGIAERPPADSPGAEILEEAGAEPGTEETGAESDRPDEDRELEPAARAPRGGEAWRARW